MGALISVPWQHCSILPLLQNVLPWLLAVSWREGCHSMAGTLPQKSCSKWLNLPSFPRAYRSMIHFQFSVLWSPVPVLAPCSSKQELLGDGLRELKTACTLQQVPRPKPCLESLESFLKSDSKHLNQRKHSTCKFSSASRGAECRFQGNKRELVMFLWIIHCCQQRWLIEVLPGHLDGN